MMPRGRRARLPWLLMSLAVAVVPSYPLHTTDTPSETRPPWEADFIVWPRYYGQPTPWRDDPRLTGQFQKDYPDDIPVYFDNPDPEVKDEVMWVTVIDHHPDSDEYLGVLTNTPHNLTTVRERDNVVFRFDSGMKRLRALTSADRFDRRGIPPRAHAGALAQVWEGVRQYRLGDEGHNQEAIDRCIATLTPAIPLLEPSTSLADLYLAHFVLGRCHAETYDTDLAIASFRKALEYRPRDVDAHMALLAEYSIKVHHSADRKPSEDDSRWETLFVEQLEFVRQNFSDDLMAAVTTKIIFDEAEVKNLSEMTAEQIARGRRLGFASFRWKRH